jgi:hypothetical protein
MLEYAVQLEKKGHKVTASVLKEQEKLVQEYGLEYILSVNHTTDASQVFDVQGMMDSDYTIEAGTGFAGEVMNHFYVKMYKTMEHWFETKKRENDLPHVLVGDVAVPACFELAEMHSIPVVTSAHLLGPTGQADFVPTGYHYAHVCFSSTTGGYLPPELTPRLLFEPSYSSELSFWKRLEQKVFPLFTVVPKMMADIKNFDKMKKEAGIVGSGKNTLTLVTDKIMLGNTFYPFSVSCVYIPKEDMVGKSTDISLRQSIRCTLKQSDRSCHQSISL